MPDVIKNQNTIKDQIPDVTYETLLTPEQSVTQKGIDFKHANVVRKNPTPGDVSIQPAKFETVPGGRVIAIKGEVGPEAAGTAGEDIADGKAAMLLSDGKFYKTDSATSISDKYSGIVQGDIKKGDQALVQTIGTASNLTGLSTSEIHYLSDGTIDVSQDRDTTSVNLNAFKFNGSNFGELHQRFTTSTDMVRCTSLELKLQRINSGAGVNNISIGIYEVDGSENPTGSALWSTSVSTDDISTTATVYNFTVDTLLSPSTMYSIYLFATSSGTYEGVRIQDVHNSDTPVGRYRSSSGTWNDDKAAYYKIRRGSGDISTTPGTYSKKAGQAFSSTILDITKN